MKKTLQKKILYCLQVSTQQGLWEFFLEGHDEERCRRKEVEEKGGGKEENGSRGERKE
jgi:hypothetical protein